ncbi:MAG TPA: hypothetical protein VHW23_24985 [Kofleriaceae bacterium]|nr:hypothetical protein [Kofleriaceae bacterium]
MAYRDDAGDACEAPTAEGPLRAELAGGDLRLAVAGRSLHVAARFVTLVEHHRKHAAKDRRTSIALAGQLVVARDAQRESLGVWVEIEPGTPRAGFRRIFGVEPLSLLEPGGLGALPALDRLTQRVRHGLAHLAPDVRRATEIGSPASGGLDKVLAVDHGERIVVYARGLFRDRARFAMTVHDDGRIAVRGTGGAAAPEVTVRSRHGVTVVGDYIRFADPHGADLARVSIPWLSPEDRAELAHRIGQRIDREDLVDHAAIWPPRLERSP